MKNYFEIGNELEVYHAVFAIFWRLGRPVFVDNIPTAQIVFDKKGHCLEYQFSKDFWDSLTPYERKFVICHEILHVLLNHGLRITNCPDKRLANIALDIVVNHLLINKFGFERLKIRKAENYCWIDTIFPNDPKIEDNRSFEYYWEKLRKNAAVPNKAIVDIHDGFASIPQEELSKIYSDALGKMSSYESETLEKSLPSAGSSDQISYDRGTTQGGIVAYIKIGKVKPKKKWETVIQKWSKNIIKVFDKDIEQWIRLNRKYHILDSNLFLPSEMEEDSKDEDKIEVWFFQDTSGSCGGYKKRFFTAAKSLPKDAFEIKMCCFDTRVYETTLESGKLYGFGGTAFSIIEDYIQADILKRKVAYPKAVFVITDGYGNRVNPKMPKNWYWFLTPHSTRRCIPSECNIFELKDFE